MKRQDNEAALPNIFQDVKIFAFF
uniref:Uncharacterized protein n=1 Tax=Lepeophtheirus salmonis TaxID=72036 RepID=A0A0K2V5G4_LEPSM